MIADCKIIILYLHIDKIKFDYVKLNFRCFQEWENRETLHSRWHFDSF